jgi:hypothetical protein
MPNRDARGDVIHMGRQHVRDGFIAVRQQKTGASLQIPVHLARNPGRAFGRALLIIAAAGKLNRLPLENSAGTRHCMRHIGHRARPFGRLCCRTPARLLPY